MQVQDITDLFNSRELLEDGSAWTGDGVSGKSSFDVVVEQGGAALAQPSTASSDAPPVLPPEVASGGDVDISSKEASPTTGNPSLVDALASLKPHLPQDGPPLPRGLPGWPWKQRQVPPPSDRT